MVSLTGVTNYFPTAQEGFTTTTSGSVASGAATVGLNSVAGYTNGDIVVFVIDPTDATKKQAFTGVVDTSGVQITGVKWTEGTNTTHSAGATVVDYETASAWAMYNKGLLVEHTQAGRHTMTSPKVITDISDTNGNELLKVTATASAVNELTLANAATGNSPTLSATGGDTNLDLTLTPKGTGYVNLNYAGAPVQMVSTAYTAVATGSTVIPADDTIPQNTEGNEYMTQAITPKSGTNILVIEANLLLSSQTAGGQFLVAALFQDSTAGALNATEQYLETGNGSLTLHLTHRMAAGTTSATTFKIRAGGSVAGITTFNGVNTSRRYGGIAISSIVITEYKA